MKHYQSKVRGSPTDGPQTLVKKTTLHVLLEVIVDVGCSYNLHQFRIFKNAAWDEQQFHTS